MDDLDALYRPFFHLFRSRRMDLFVRTMKPDFGKTVLDVGVTSSFWRLRPDVGNVVILNLRRDRGGPSRREIVGDGRMLPFPSKSVDIVFSNSVIEHLGDLRSQRVFAEEIARVGTSHFIQTPYKSFPVDPHYMSPNFQVFFQGPVWGN